MINRDNYNPPATYRHFSDVPKDLQEIILDAEAGRNLGKCDSLEDLLVEIGLDLEKEEVQRK